MRAAFTSCPSGQRDPEMQASMKEEEGLAFLQNPEKHSIVYASTTQPPHYIPRGRRLCGTQMLCGVLLVVILATSVIALEMYRNTEILRLRSDCDQLRTDLDDLKHRLLEDDMLEAIRAFEQQSYAEDHAATTNNDENSSLSEDDIYDDYDEDDDEDDEDEEEDEGDVEPEPNDENNDGLSRKRREVELQPPVIARRPLFLGRTEDGVPVLSHSYQHIKELNRTGGLSNLRLYDTLGDVKDSTSTSTEDPIKPHHRISPLWVPHKWRKQGDPKSSYHKRRTPTVTASPYPVMERRSRVMQTPDEGESVSTTFGKDAPASLRAAPRHIAASSSSQHPHGEVVMRVLQPHSGEHHQAPQASEVQPPTFIRAGAGAVLTRSNDPSNPNGDAVKGRRRRKHRLGTRKHASAMEMDDGLAHPPSRLAAHFGANATMYLMGHPHFAGNGRLRHPGVFSDWAATSWMRDLGMDNHFVLSEGVLTVRQGGLYFFYAQIYYIDDHDTNGYNVYVNDQARLQCTTMTHSSAAVTKTNTCYTGSVLLLHPGDTIYMRDIAGLRYSLFEPDKSFFGLFRLGEARVR